MSTYREPTETETKAYKAALNKVLPPVQGAANAVELVKMAIESVFGPCVYERLDKGQCQVTQIYSVEQGVQIRFLLDVDLPG
jgi:hypothetical protein